MPSREDDPVHTVRTIARIAQMIIELRDEYVASPAPGYPRSSSSSAWTTSSRNGTNCDMRAAHARQQDQAKDRAIR